MKRKGGLWEDAWGKTAVEVGIACVFFVPIIIMMIDYFMGRSGWVAKKEDWHILIQLYFLAAFWWVAAGYFAGSKFDGEGIFETARAILIVWFFGGVLPWGVLSGVWHNSILLVPNNLIGGVFYSAIGFYMGKSSALESKKTDAEQWSPYAQFALGLAYHNGDKVEQDYEKAVYWYKKAAERGDENAQHNLGLLFAEGEGVQKDLDEAIYWTQKAAKQGNDETQRNLGLLYLHQGKGQEASYWLQKAAEQGSPHAQFSLGLMYYDGNEVEQDYEKAIYWYKKAAEQGDIHAQSGLRGLCVGDEYDPQEYIQAYALASRHPTQESQKVLDYLSEKMTPDQIAQAQQMARNFKPKGNR